MTALTDTQRDTIHAIINRKPEIREDVTAPAMPIIPAKPLKQVKYGGINLDIQPDNADKLIPTDAIEIKLPPDDRQALAVSIKDNLPALLIGETGTGKTSIVKYLAYKTNRPYVRVNMTGFTTPDELIGSKSVNNGATYYEHGIITDAMQRGAMLVIDEINATTPDCLFIIHGLLDEDRRITLPNGDVITPAGGFRVMATCNPDYEGTKSLNKALIDRFPIILNIDVISPKMEAELLVKRTDINPELAVQLVTIATLLRKDYAEGKIATYTSTRSLLYISQLIKEGIEPKTAFNTVLARKTTNKQEQRAIMDIYASVMKQATEGDASNALIVIKQSEIDYRDNKINELGKAWQEAKDRQAEAERNIDSVKRELSDSKEEIKRREADITKLLTKTEEQDKQITFYKQLDEIVKQIKK